MSQATAAPAQSELMSVSIKSLLGSMTNPRRTFDEKSLEELAESIKQNGILQPLVVRRLGDGSKFEIVCGERRHRAAKKAGVDQVPVIVRDFTDDQALEAQVVENLQREDVAPLEEAWGYQEMLKRGAKIEDLAERIGKSTRYIYARLELQKLSGPVTKALEKGEITPSHAQLIARLDAPEQQELALKQCFVEGWGRGEAEADMVVRPTGNADLSGLVPVRDLEKTVAALKVGAELVEQLEALKLAGHKAALVSELTYVHNRSRQVLGRNRWKSQGKKPCKYPAKGILVDGSRRGRTVDVCITTSCKKHFATHPVATHTRASTAQVEKERQRQELEAIKSRRKSQLLLELAKEAVKGGPPKLGVEELRFLVQSLLRGEPPAELEVLWPKLELRTIWHSRPGRLAKPVAALPEKDIVGIVRFCLMGDRYEELQEDLVLQSCHRSKVDVKAIRRKFEARWKDEDRTLSIVRASSADAVKEALSIKKESSKLEEPTCGRCKCTESKACAGGCSWVVLDRGTNHGLCSACVKPEELAKLDGTAKREHQKKG